MVRKVLVGTDTSNTSEVAVQAAADLAREWDAGLVVLYVQPPLDPRGMFSPPGRGEPVADPGGYLATVQARYPGVSVAGRRAEGDPATTICAVAADEGADVIVVGTPGPQARRRRLVRSVPQAVVQHANCSVMVVDTGRVR